MIQYIVVFLVSPYHFAVETNACPVLSYLMNLSALRCWRQLSLLDSLASNTVTCQPNDLPVRL